MFRGLRGLFTRRAAAVAPAPTPRVIANTPLKDLTLPELQGLTGANLSARPVAEFREISDKVLRGIQPAAIRNMTGRNASTKKGLLKKATELLGDYDKQMNTSLYLTRYGWKRATPEELAAMTPAQMNEYQEELELARVFARETGYTKGRKNIWGPNRGLTAVNKGKRNTLKRMQGVRNQRAEDRALAEGQEQLDLVEAVAPANNIAVLVEQKDTEWVNKIQSMKPFAVKLFTSEAVGGAFIEGLMPGLTRFFEPQSTVSANALFEAYKRKYTRDNIPDDAIRTLVQYLEEVRDGFNNNQGAGNGATLVEQDAADAAYTRGEGGESKYDLNMRGALVDGANPAVIPVMWDDDLKNLDPWSGFIRLYEGDFNVEYTNHDAKATAALRRILSLLMTFKGEIDEEKVAAAAALAAQAAAVAAAPAAVRSAQNAQKARYAASLQALAADRAARAAAVKAQKNAQALAVAEEGARAAAAAAAAREKEERIEAIPLLAGEELVQLMSSGESIPMDYPLKERQELIRRFIGEYSISVKEATDLANIYVNTWEKLRREYNDAPAGAAPLGFSPSPLAATAAPLGFSPSPPSLLSSLPLGAAAVRTPLGAAAVRTAAARASRSASRSAGATSPGGGGSRRSKKRANKRKTAKRRSSR